MLWLLLVVACGGSVEGGSSSEGEPAKGATPPAEAGEGDASADTELGRCALGRKEDYREPCSWVADGRCYQDRAMACNCACPRSGNSQCTSGFDNGPDGHVWVTCN